jgi:uncharacterized protein YndB with AHSA1/START domain
VSEIARTVSIPPDPIFAVLADGWLYASWVVGASHVRSVDADWPAVGARIHHTVGPWPLVIRDQTEVLGSEPNSLLELHARMWPAGAARVRLTLLPHEGGGCEVRMTETIVEGPLRSLPQGAQDAILRPRNTESLSRLLDIARGRWSGRGSSS